MNVCLYSLLWQFQSFQLRLSKFMKTLKVTYKFKHNFTLRNKTKCIMGKQFLRIKALTCEYCEVVRVSWDISFNTVTYHLYSTRKTEILQKKQWQNSKTWDLFIFLLLSLIMNYGINKNNNASLKYQKASKRNLPDKRVETHLSLSERPSAPLRCPKNFHLNLKKIINESSFYCVT